MHAIQASNLENIQMKCEFWFVTEAFKILLPEFEYLIEFFNKINGRMDISFSVKISQAPTLIVVCLRLKMRRKW